jgi:hypothetical protein
MEWKSITLKSFALVGMVVVATHIVKVAVKADHHCDLVARAEGRCTHFDRAVSVPASWGSLAASVDAAPSTP